MPESSKTMSVTTARILSASGGSSVTRVIASSSRKIHSAEIAPAARIHLVTAPHPIGAQMGKREQAAERAAGIALG